MMMRTTAGMALIWASVGLAFGWTPAFWTLLLLAPVWVSAALVGAQMSGDALAMAMALCPRLDKPDTLEDVRERAMQRHPSNYGSDQ